LYKSIAIDGAALVGTAMVGGGLWQLGHFLGCGSALALVWCGAVVMVAAFQAAKLTAIAKTKRKRRA